MTINQRRVLALSIALVLHVALAGLLWWLRIRSERSRPQPTELVVLDIGNVDMAQGDTEPMGGSATDPTPSPTPQPQPTPVEPRPAVRPQSTQAKPSTQPTTTQPNPEALRLANEAEAKRQAEAKAQREAQARATAEAEMKARAEAEEARRKAQQAQAGNSVANAFGKGQGQGTSHGNASSGAGNQGNPQGVSGGSFSLSGRTIISNGGRLMPPSANRAIRGTIVVRIVVNARGQVTEANVSPRGTTITDEAIRASALQAARKTAFNPQPDAPEQSGTITYNYDIQ